MNEDVNNPEQAAPAGAGAMNEFAAYGDEDPSVPYLPLPSASPQPLAEQRSPAHVADTRTPSLSSFPKAGEPAALVPGSLRKLRRRIILVLVIGIGCGCIAFAYDGYWMRFGITTQGTIVNATSHACNGNGGRGSAGSSYVYEVQFTDTTGQVQVHDLDGCYSFIGDVAVGDSITIIYIPSDPTHIKFKEDLVLQFAFIVCMAAVLIIILVRLVLEVKPYELVA